MRFDRIMDALVSGEVDGGVIIHESRFTYQERGLHCVQDLGAWWEAITGLPIPLGCIVARRTLAPEVRAAIDAAIAASIRWADTHPDEGRDYIRQHAQEMDEAVCRQHIDLYVNASTTSGAVGTMATPSPMVCNSRWRRAMKWAWVMRSDRRRQR